MASAAGSPERVNGNDELPVGRAHMFFNNKTVTKPNEDIDLYIFPEGVKEINGFETFNEDLKNTFVMSSETFNELYPDRELVRRVSNYGDGYFENNELPTKRPYTLITDDDNEIEYEYYNNNDYEDPNNIRLITPKRLVLIFKALRNLHLNLLKARAKKDERDIEKKKVQFDNLLYRIYNIIVAPITSYLSTWYMPRVLKEITKEFDKLSRLPEYNFLFAEDSSFISIHIYILKANEYTPDEYNPMDNWLLAKKILEKQSILDDAFDLLDLSLDSSSGDAVDGAGEKVSNKLKTNHTSRDF